MIEQGGKLLRWLAAFFCTQCLAAELPPGAEMIYLQTERIKLGVDMTRGGAIVYLAEKGGRNLINNYDLGRQVQASFYSGPVPYEEAGQKPTAHWAHLGWNPVQAGDDFKHGSKAELLEQGADFIKLKCQPLQWPLSGVKAECSIQSSIFVKGALVTCHTQLQNARSDKTQYPARLQELPAVYANSALHRVVSYTGSKPFTDEPVSDIAAVPAGAKHPWSFWLGTEGWSAVVDDQGRGLGLITPQRIHFTGGLAGKSGSEDTLAVDTSYLAGQAQVILDHNIRYSYRYELVVGSIAEIRSRAANEINRQSSGWPFHLSRSDWHYVNARDTGWPVHPRLHVLLEQADAQLISPYTFWVAEEQPYFTMTAAFSTQEKEARVYWQRHGEEGFQSSMSFPIVGDGKLRSYKVKLAGQPGYSGPMVRLRLDPVSEGEAGAKLELLLMSLAKE